MDYITTAQAAVKWDITANRISILAKNGRIPGALRIGHTWMIPQNVNKPYDARTKADSEKYCENVYRFPSFIYRNPESFCPPLTDEEKKIKEAQEASHACRFEDVDTILGNLVQKTKNRYLRIAALYTKCMTYIALADSKAFLLNYSALQADFQTDFPYKLEMQEYLREISAALGFNNPYSNPETINTDFDYDKSFLPYLGVISVMSLYESINARKLTVSELLSFETNCYFIETSGDFFCILTANLLLGLCYAVRGENEVAKPHIKKALEIAYKYNMLFQVVDEYYYLSNVIEPVLHEFPEEFQNKVRTLSRDVHNNYVDFMNRISLKNIYNSVLHKEYLFILYAVQGYSNKEVSKLLSMNENTVAKKYSNIYAELGVAGKKELVELYNHSTEPKK